MSRGREPARRFVSRWNIIACEPALKLSVDRPGVLVRRSRISSLRLRGDHRRGGMPSGGDSQDEPAVGTAAMIVRISKPLTRLVLPAVVGVVVASGAACSDDPAAGPGPQLRQFCEDLFASPAFGCCSESDRQDRQFSVRNGYGTSAAECGTLLEKVAAETQGRSVFNSEAAASCLVHLAGRRCGALPSATVRLAEDQAGCHRLLAGTQAEGQSCNTSSDCTLGLVCPPPKATGGSVCIKPAPINQGCTGPSTSGDHPPCETGLTCAFFQSNPECAAPPCTEYRCVPFAAAGEPCEANECASGLSCREGICNSDGPGTEGQACKVFEHCSSGLYCDSTTGTCAPQRRSGAECGANANTTFECKGVCKQGAGGVGTCAAFCGSD